MQGEILIGPGIANWILLWLEDGRLMEEDL